LDFVFCKKKKNLERDLLEEVSKRDFSNPSCPMRPHPTFWYKGIPICKNIQKIISCLII